VIGSPSSVQEVDARLAAFRPVRHKNLAETVVVSIVDAIRGGLYEPGDRLPTTRELAAALEVGQAVIGEAMGILDRAGIVSVRRGAHGGAFVETRWIPHEVIAAIEGESYANMASLLEARRILETQAAVMAGARRTKRDLAALKRLVDKLPELMEDPEEFLAVDIQFHLKLAEVSKSDVVARLVRQVLTQFMSERTSYPVGHIDMKRALEHHRETLEAIAERTPGRIRRTMDAHLGSAEEYFLGKRLNLDGGATPAGQAP
jgi:GntR family transcriptional repressor for pyruvate dehydrogenase complex